METVSFNGGTPLIDRILMLISAFSIGTHEFCFAKKSVDIFFKPALASSNLT